MRHGDAEVDQLCQSLQRSQAYLEEQSAHLDTKSDALDQERAELEVALEALGRDRDELKARESALARLEHLARRGQPATEIAKDATKKTDRQSEQSFSSDSSHQAPAIEHFADESAHVDETMDAIPVVFNDSNLARDERISQIKQELQRREDWLIVRATSLTERELELRRVRGELRLEQERVKTAKSVVERRSASLDQLKSSLDEEKRGLEVHRMNQDRKRAKLNEVKRSSTRLDSP